MIDYPEIHIRKELINTQWSDMSIPESRLIYLVFAKACKENSYKPIFTKKEIEDCISVGHMTIMDLLNIVRGINQTWVMIKNDKETSLTSIISRIIETENSFTIEIQPDLVEYFMTKGADSTNGIIFIKLNYKDIVKFKQKLTHRLYTILETHVNQRKKINQNKEWITNLEEIRILLNLQDTYKTSSDLLKLIDRLITDININSPMSISLQKTRNSDNTIKYLIFKIFIPKKKDLKPFKPRNKSKNKTNKQEISEEKIEITNEWENDFNV